MPLAMERNKVKNMKHQLIGWASWIWLDNATVTQKTVNELKMHQQDLNKMTKDKKNSPTIKTINQNSSAYSIKSLFT